MSVHLVGGGRDLDLAEAIYGRFVAEGLARSQTSGRVPRFGVVVIAEGDALAGVDWFAQALSRCASVEVVAATADEEPTAVLQLADGSTAEGSCFHGLDGLLVGGGLTPAYHRVLQPYGAAIRAAVADGLPYAGFSAGAAIAAARALLGGWRLGSAAVTHEDNAEDLDQVTVVEGIGLVAPTVEVHTAQWGTLSRLVAAVADGATEQGVAIDENTVVIFDPAIDSPTAVEVRGLGQAWFVDRGETAVRVERRPPG